VVYVHILYCSIQFDICVSRGRFPTTGYDGIISNDKCPSTVAYKRVACSLYLTLFGGTLAAIVLLDGAANTIDGGTQ
jgi:hypothetical protein